MFFSLIGRHLDELRATAPLGSKSARRGKCRRLVAADRTPVGRIEREDHWLPAEVGKGDGLVGCGVEGEPG